MPQLHPIRAAHQPRRFVSGSHGRIALKPSAAIHLAGCRTQWIAEAFQTGESFKDFAGARRQLMQCWRRINQDPGQLPSGCLHAEGFHFRPIGTLA